MSNDLLAGFEDGDILDVVWRLESGKLVEERIDYGLVDEFPSGPVLLHFTYRPDSCADQIPVAAIVDVRLVTPRRDRSAEDLRTG